MMEKRAIQAIDDAFSQTGIDLFLASLNFRGARISSIQEVSSDLTDWITGGPYRRGETFITSFWEVYSTLGDEERSRVNERYQSQVSLVPEELKRRYPMPFRS